MSWLPVTVATAPVSEPVTLAQVKDQARIDGTDSDTLLTGYITAARMFVEEHTGARLMTQTLDLRCSSFDDLAAFTAVPLQSITSLKYLDPFGVEQTLSTSIYETVLIGLEPSIRLALNQKWPSIRSASDAIRIVAAAGFAAIPVPITHAMMLLISSWYDSRNSGGIPEGVIALLSNYRR